MDRLYPKVSFASLLNQSHEVQSCILCNICLILVLDVDSFQPLTVEEYSALRLFLWFRLFQRSKPLSSFYFQEKSLCFGVFLFHLLKTLKS